MRDLDSPKATLVLRVVQAAFAIIVLGLSAYVAHWWSGYWNAYSPSEINFLIFCAVWTLLALVYLIVVPLRFHDTKAHHAFAILAIELITMIFWFAGFIAVAVFLNDRGCLGGVCSAAKAATVFAAFLWLAFAITTTLAVLRVFQQRGTGKSSHADPNLNVQAAV